MAVVAYPMPDPWVVTGPSRPARLDRWDDRDRLDRLVRPGARVYRRRRAVTLSALAAVVLAIATLLRLALAGPGGGALTTAGSPGAAPVTAGAASVGHVYVVQPGDSLWSIVLASGHRGDPRPEVDRLALTLNGRPLHVGQRLKIP